MSDCAAGSTVEAVLAGSASYDSLATASEQAAVRAVWHERMRNLRESLDLAAEFRMAGAVPWFEAGGHGQVLFRT